MSLILDALRRAEHGRTRDLGQRLGQALPPRARPDRRWIVPTIAITVIAVLVAWIWFLAQPVAPLEPVVTTATPQQAARRSPAGSSLADIPMPESIAEAAPIEPERAPLFQELPAAERARIPVIELDAHFWSPEPSRRFVMIGMARHRAGDTLQSGLRVNAILPEGVELEWRSTRFRILAQ